MLTMKKTSKPPNRIWLLTYLAPDLENPFGKTPLNQAVDYGHKEIAELPTAAGADINVMDGQRCTPLVYAVSDENKEFADLRSQTRRQNQEGTGS